MGETNPELEAAIEKDPDDEDAYLILGDWLQTRDDPRGELIALQAAVLRDPGDKKLAKRADKHLEEHAGELLGKLAERKALTVAWHLGFIRDARISHGKIPRKPFPAEYRDLLQELLDHPSSRFLQSLTIESSPGLDPTSVVELLLERRGPVTLADLRLGRDWDTAKQAPELLEVFPRLHRSLDVEWRRIAQVVAEARKVDLKYDAAKLPKLVEWPNVEAPGVDNVQILHALKLEIDKKRELGVVAAMKRSFTVESLDRFAVALGKQFQDEGETTAMRWGYLAMGHLGDAQTVAWIGERFGPWSHQRAVQGAEMLGQIRSGAALWELYGLSTDRRYMRSRRDDAAAVLGRVAAQRSVGVDQLLDRSLPKADGRVGRVRDAAARRLEQHMIDGRRIPHHDFIHYFVSHPTSAPLARRVVWATYDGIDVELTFRIDIDGEPIDVNGTEIDLEGAAVGVLHPAELRSDERRILAQWAEVFRAEKMSPLFPQIDRPIQELREQDRGLVVTRFKLRSAGWEQLRAGFEQELDWARDTEDEDHGPLTIGWRRLFPRDGVTAIAAVAGGTSIESVTLERQGKKVRFAKIHPVTASEILAGVDRATGRERVADPPAANVNPEVERGMRVQITRGAGRLREGVVFWLGDGNNGPRVGLRTDEDETLWANLTDVRPTTATEEPAGDREVTARPRNWSPEDERDAPPQRRNDNDDDAAPADNDEAKPTITKGMKVKWSKGRHEGTGVAFWIGKNKFGDGMRVGVKDDETGETVWADANDCEPVA